MSAKAGQFLFTLLAVVVGCCSCSSDLEDDGGSAAAFSRQPIDDKWLSVKAGDWGELEYRRFFLPLPEAWLKNSSSQELVDWHLPRMDVASVNAMVLEVLTTDTEKKLWDKACKTELLTNEVVIHPSKEFRWSLSSKSRSALYLWLGQFPANNTLALPFCCATSGYDRWFKDAGIPPEVERNIRSLSYVAADGVVCFADLDLIDERFAGEFDQAALLAVLYRHPYCELRLHVSKNTNTQALAGYWGESSRANKVKRKFKDSLGKQTEAWVSLADVIPPLPRGLLNTYPALPKTPEQTMPDCYWTAFNFFNQKPDKRLSDMGFVMDSLSRYYNKVEGQPRYGDLLFFVNSAGQPIHVCVYLADDLVYTKNGGHFTQPWVFMKLEDLKACYPQPRPLRITCYRWSPQKARPAST